MSYSVIQYFIGGVLCVKICLAAPLEVPEPPTLSTSLLLEENAPSNVALITVYINVIVLSFTFYFLRNTIP